MANFQATLYRTWYWKWLSNFLGETYTRSSIPHIWTAFKRSFSKLEISHFRWWYFRIRFYFCRNLFLIKCFINPKIIPVFTTISPVSFVHSVQRTPQLVVISFGTGLVWYSFVSERYTAALASCCLDGTPSFCETNNKNTTFELSGLKKLLC